MAVWLGGTGLVSLYSRHLAQSHHSSQTWRLPSAGAGVVLALYAAFTVVCVVGCAVAATRALARARLDDRSLAVSAVLAAAASAALGVVTIAAAVCLTRVLLVGGIDPRNTAMAVAPTVLLVLASVSAMTSSLRALPQLTAPVSPGGPDT